MRIVVAERRVDLRYFAIAFVPITIFSLNAVITGHLIAADLNVPVDILQTDRPWLEAVGRYRFLAATWFFVALAVLPVALLARNLSRPMARETRMVSIATVIVISLLALTPVLQQNADPEATRIYHRLGADVFEAALSMGTLPGCAGPERIWLMGACGDVPVVTLFHRTLDIVTVVAGLAVGALIVGMILCLEARDSEDVEDVAAQLARNFQQMRQQLYLSSLILTFGMFFATSWMHWPLPLITETEKPAYSALVLASALFTGTYFSLLLLSFYLPVALILDGRVKQLADAAARAPQSGEALDINDWKTSHGLKEGASDYIRAGFALTAPILAAFTGGISPIAF
ncbi:hypothetical protein RA28_00360 [Ruegeria sp. ANG-S4]|uniref:hypothetical protein n=1 Tax=Ruegeria sp. ANG-S4 TaxID=1577904 RepID=UPI00057EA4AE|nr:hypothetical protein [Ruegeria sp. ANG-S4]KIC46306.1 hypothetical protein RA28_00360 [Ruegeria sp. ANG-S4]